MDDLELSRTRWLAEKPIFESFGQLVVARLQVATRSAGIWCQITSRPKEMHSLIKKLFKGKHTYASLPDKVGARCVVRYRHEVESVLAVAEKTFSCAEIDRKADRLGEATVGYLGTHVEVRLAAGDSNAPDFPAGEFILELQIRTLGQHVWSEMSHDSVYKNESLLAKLSPDVIRRVNLMSGLIEVADREFERIDTEVSETPAAYVFKSLEKNYYKVSSERPDRELSEEIINLLIPLYGTDFKDIAIELDEFFAAHESDIQSVYTLNPGAIASPLLWQPEAIMLYERLDKDSLNTRIAWSEHFPERELERVANVFGFSFD